MVLTTVTQYCKDRNVTKQFVYEYIKKKKFQVLELPIFIIIDGKNVEVGTKKFLQVPPQYSVEKIVPKAYWSGEVSDDDYALGLAQDATEDLELQLVLTTHLKLTKAEEKAASKIMIHAAYPVGHVKRSALDLAFENVRKIMIAEVMDIDDQVTGMELRKKMN